MLDFFIALFGGIFHGSKLYNDRQKSKRKDEANKQKLLEMQIDLSAWLRKVTDTKLESELDKLVASNMNRIYEEMKQVLSCVMPNIKDADDFRASIFWQNPSLIKLVIMAQHGKIPNKEAQYGVRSPAVYNETEIKKWKQVYSIMSWVDRELEKHGIETMVFSDGSEAHLACFTGKARPIGDVRVPIGGVYYWWSCRYNIR